MTVKGVSSFLVVLLSSGPLLLAAETAPAAPPIVAPVGPEKSPVPDLPGMPSPAAIRATAAYEGGRPAAVIRSGPTLEVPFGHAPTPTLSCAPLRACAIELEAGEVVLTTAAGDATRWLIEVATAGPGGSTPLVVVKPTECDLSTNLLIATDRRIYELRLDAPRCPKAAGDFNPKLSYTSRIRFYYPDQLVRRWRAAAADGTEEAARQEGSGLPLSASLADLNFNYTWRKRHTWAPQQVFDDGRRTYVRLPAAVRKRPAPALFAVNGGKTALLNYSFEGDWYVVDRVVERLALVLSEGRGQPKRLVIENQGYRSR